MKFKILSIVTLLSLFSIGSAFAGDYRHQSNHKVKANKTVKVIERPHTTTRVVSTKNGVKRVTTQNNTHASNQKIVKKKVVTNTSRSSSGDRVGLFVGGLVLGSLF